MKNLILFCCFLVIVFSCKNSPSGNDGSLNTDPSSEIASPADVVEGITGLRQFVGKKPNEIDLFNKFGIKNRISAMMKDEFPNFEKSWANSEPIKIDEDLVYTSGCSAEGCGSLRHFIIFDMTLNVINIFQFKGDKVRSYEQSKNVIGMTENLSLDFERILAEQKIQ